MLIDYLPYILQGLLVTIQVSVLALILTVIAGFTLALCRMSTRRLVSWPAIAVIEIFRGTSAIVQLFWVFYVLPLFGINLNPLVSAVIVLGLNEGSYLSEVVRGAIVGVPRAQRESSLALGYGPITGFVRVILPQALVLMIPPGTNIIVSLIKFTSLVSLVTVSDLTYSALAARSNVGQTTVIFTIVLLTYYALTSLVVLGMRKLEKRVATYMGMQPTQETRPSQVMQGA